MEKQYRIFVALVILLSAFVTVVSADTEIPEAVFFRGDVTINGIPAPIGTIVEAFDPTGIKCGGFIVGENADTAGVYGLMAVSNDDTSTPSIDEGCTSGDSVFFMVNGIDPVVTIDSGDVIWTSNGDVNIVSFAITQTISLSIVETPNDSLVAPGWTVKLRVGIQNDGDGTDFYRVSSTSDPSPSPGWITTDQDSVSHALAGEITYVYFDVYLPTFGGGGDTAFTIPYTVYSDIDNSVSYSDSVIFYKSITDVADDMLSVLPDQFNLLQNYPNPFNPSTIIAFNLPTSSRTTIEIINILGQTVDKLELGQLAAGIHKIEYDASDLPGGIYLYRLNAGQYVESKKMLLLK